MSHVLCISLGIISVFIACKLCVCVCVCFVTRVGGGEGPGRRSIGVY